MNINIPIGNGKSFKLSLSKLFFPFLIFVLVVLVFLKFSELREIGRLFAQIKWYWLIAVVGAQFLNLILQTNVYHRILDILKMPKIKFWEFLKISLTVIFLNFTIPSYGFAGNIYLVKLLKKKFNFQEGRSLMIIILQLISFYLSLVILIIITLIYMFIQIGRLELIPLIAGIAFVTLCLVVFLVLRFWFANREKAPKRVAWFAKRFYKFDSEGDNLPFEARVRIFLNEFYSDLDWLKDNKRKLIRPILIQLFKFFSDGLTVFVIFLAFGHLISYGISLSTYALGQLIGLVSFVPGGIGFFEGAMALTSKSLGVSLELSVTVMLIYRFFSYWLYFPVGLIFYRKLSKELENGSDSESN